MLYAARRMDGNRTTNERRVTVPEAAEILGISPEAVRARLSRGTLEREKGEDGTTYVRLNDDRTQSNDDRTGDITVAGSLAYQLMHDEIAFLRRELERKDHLLAAALERIPAIEPPPDTPSEPRDGRETASGEPGGGEVGEERERRSWWQRMFGG